MKVFLNLFDFKYRVLSISLIASVIKEIEGEGLQKHFHVQRKEILR